MLSLERTAAQAQSLQRFHSDPARQFSRRATAPIRTTFSEAVPDRHPGGDHSRRADKQELDLIGSTQPPRDAVLLFEHRVDDDRRPDRATPRRYFGCDFLDRGAPKSLCGRRLRPLGQAITSRTRTVTCSTGSTAADQVRVRRNRFRRSGAGPASRPDLPVPDFSRLRSDLSRAVRAEKRTPPLRSNGPRREPAAGSPPGRKKKWVDVGLPAADAAGGAGRAARLAHFSVRAGWSEAGQLTCDCALYHSAM